MGDVISVAMGNLLTPMVLFFALGFIAAQLRSDLEIPEAISKGLAIYLMASIGFQGGVKLSHAGFGLNVALSLLAAVALSFLLPFLAYFLLRATTLMKRETAAAVAAHYGSISVVTFVTATEFLNSQGIPFEGHLVAMMALMETPAIVSGLLLARRGASKDGGGLAGDNPQMSGEVLREIFVNGSVVLLVGGFLIGWTTGDRGMDAVGAFMLDPFKGVLCLFLLEMGLVASRRLRASKLGGGMVLAFGLYMPLVGALAGLCMAWLLGLSVGGATLLAVLGASASYIAVPAAMRLAVPKADPGVYVTLALAITFPFNVVIGIPVYLAAATWLFG
ncbi:sodium-dependent bicarbonate transport family permease [Telmatospirillum sp. J64-1]|uniref:sodium-dependent bicarbonate transport family permease n=1 Tax=Telmatospirillum sp. J64-1 TaxID=2502183 RepID=UPI00115E3C72|nr:sodium-dependent bicarbonate transport family permease [Telmatospirillum sp. J64-1]